ncbi:unnamed protein product [Cunninghamella blakesleeana]
MPRLYTLFQAKIITLQWQQQRKKLFFQFQSTSYFSTSKQQKVHQQYTQSSSSSFGRDHQYNYYENVVTENTILSAFPRPNLTPTLHHTLFYDNALNNNNTNQQKNKIKCKNCQGPHKSEHCPC